MRQERVEKFKVPTGWNLVGEEVQHVPELSRVVVRHRGRVPRPERANLGVEPRRASLAKMRDELRVRSAARVQLVLVLVVILILLAVLASLLPSQRRELALSLGGPAFRFVLAFRELDLLDSLRLFAPRAAQADKDTLHVAAVVPRAGEDPGLWVLLVLVVAVVDDSLQVEHRGLGRVVGVVRGGDEEGRLFRFFRRLDWLVALAELVQHRERRPLRAGEHGHGGEAVRDGLGRAASLSVAAETLGPSLLLRILERRLFGLFGEVHVRVLFLLLGGAEDDLAGIAELGVEPRELHQRLHRARYVVVHRIALLGIRIVGPLGTRNRERPGRRIHLTVRP
mmetsp:Transcript_7949/g.36210  ORF Transcript_7949/g.36210 Transcript_7949/m.36210 type:complete len:338 (+) Transcript_7949:212-1225(+)